MTTSIRNLSLATAAALILALSACGGGGGPSGPVTEADPPTTPVDPPTSPNEPTLADLPDWPVDPRVLDRGETASLDHIPALPQEILDGRDEETKNTINLEFFGCGDGTCQVQYDDLISYRGIDFVQQRGVFLKEHIRHGIDDSEDIYWHYVFGYLNSGHVIAAGRIFNSGYNAAQVRVLSDQEYGPSEVRALYADRVEGSGSSRLWTDSYGRHAVSGRYSGVMLGTDIYNGNIVLGDASIRGRLVDFSPPTMSLPSQYLM